jgi:hypothetical protein
LCALVNPARLFNCWLAREEVGKMEAVLGLFLIVMLFALFSGMGRSSEGDRPVTRTEVAPSRSAPASAATSDDGLGLLPALILLLTVMALMFNAR